MGFLLWLENTSLADSVRTSVWVYPWVNSFHSVGMGFLVGVIFMIILRVLGFGRFSVAPFEKFLLVVRIAVVVNVLTGLVLFVADADRFFFSPTFRLKMLFIVLGGTTAWALTRIVFRNGGADWSPTGDAPRMAKVVAGVSFVCWAGAILAGRLTAYLP